MSPVQQEHLVFLSGLDTDAVVDFYLQHTQRWEYYNVLRLNQDRNRIEVAPLEGGGKTLA
jgi:hypothetical protein